MALAIFVALRFGEFDMDQTQVGTLLLGLYFILESVRRLVQSRKEGTQQGIQLSAELVGAVGTLFVLWGTLAGLRG